MPVWCQPDMTMSLAGVRKLLAPAIAVLVAVLALFAWSQFPSITSSLSKPGSGPDHHSPENVYFGTRNSIAVLPFAGSTKLHEEAFWSTGFSSELHHLLTRTTGLRVTSWNSSVYFQGRPVPLRIAGERLQSTHLLTGEFQLSDEGIRVSAVLYDAKQELELWSRVYERTLDDVFTVQDDILASIVEAMKVGQGDSLPKAELVDTQAWAFFLRGFFLRQQRTPDGLRHAEEAYLSALEIEPGYEMARVDLAGLWLERAAGGENQFPFVENARDALTTALQSRPELAEAHGLLSYIRRTYDWDWRGALEAAEQAIRFNPGDPELMSTLSLAMFTLGQFEEAGELLEASVSQDPLNLARRLRLGLLQEFSGDPEQALSSYRQIIGLNPEYPAARAFRARVKIIQEKPDSAMRESEQEIDPFWKRYSQILALTAQQRHDEAESLLEQMIAQDGPHAAYQVTEILAFRSDIDAAFDWFQRAYDQKDGGMSEILGNYFLQNLHGDPRWEEMLSRLDLPLDLNR